MPVVTVAADTPTPPEADHRAPGPAPEVAPKGRRAWSERAALAAAVGALALAGVTAAVFDGSISSTSRGALRGATGEAATTQARCRPSEPGAVAGCDHVRTARYFFGRRETGDLGRAEREFKAALDANPGLADAWAGLAGVYSVRIAQQGSDEAGRLVELRLAAIRNALAADPGCAEALARYSQHLHMSGRHDEARRTLQQALSLGPEDPATLSIAAGDALYEGRIEAAVELQRRAAAAGSIAGLHYSNLAAYYMIAGRYADAHAELQAMLEFGQQRGSVAEDLAALLVLEGRYQDALGELERLPANSRRDALLAMTFASLGRSVDAAAAVRRLEGGNDPADAIRLGEVYAQFGDDERAARWVEEARRRWAATCRDSDVVVKSAVVTSPFLAPRRERMLAALHSPNG
jgi:Flp pilus assembly protein TadD